jgi:lipopolysaccharide/colanic/teichoic acid biosynthesis glycosyltransferase
MLPDVDRLFGQRQAEEDGPRVTRIEKFIRATAFDELPQSQG